MNRYERVFSLIPNQYSPGACLIIEKGALLKDTVKNDAILAQLKFLNISNKTITAVELTIACLDIKNIILVNDFTYQYLDLFVLPHSSFGSDIPIYLPNKKTRNIKIINITVIFSDNTQEIIDNFSCTLSDNSIFSDNTDIQSEYQAIIGETAKYKYIEEFGIWHCSCGTINLLSNSKCEICNCNIDTHKKINIVELQNNVAKKRAIKNKNQKRIILITSIIAVLIYVVGCIISQINYTAKVNTANNISHETSTYENNMEVSYKEITISTNFYEKGSGKCALSIFDTTIEDGKTYIFPINATTTVSTYNPQSQTTDILGQMRLVFDNAKKENNQYIWTYNQYTFYEDKHYYSFYITITYEE